MRVFVAGATGAIGRPLIEMLVANGHDVTGTTRSSAKADMLRALGAEPAIVDALNRDEVKRAVDTAQPDVIVHELTAIQGIGSNMRRFDRYFTATNRLRTQGTDNLLAAANGARFVAQSFAPWVAQRAGGPIKTEEDPSATEAPPGVQETLAAILYLEEKVTDYGGLILRYGGFYGPGTSMAPGGEQYEAVRKRRLPVVGDGGGIMSLVHIEDAAEATAIAVERGAPGLYNIVDDEPAPVREWLPALAQAAGAKPPRHVPAWLGRLAGGQEGIAMMTQIRGASNAKAKRELGWTPRHASWREGFRGSLRS
jgi:2-alkyl-3-oxoalkanoate reductase